MADPDEFVPTEAEYNESCRLVGNFMNSWAFLESALNSGIATILGMDQLEGVIATNNMQARSKIHIIKTVINLRGTPKEWCAKSAKTMEAIGSMADLRNVVAHVPFGPHENGGVDFIAVKAKGKLHYPEMVWSKAQFEAHDETMERLGEELKSIIAQLEKTGSLLNAYAAWTKAKQTEPGPQNALTRLLLGNPDSLQATPEECPQKQQDPETK